MNKARYMATQMWTVWQVQFKNVTDGPMDQWTEMNNSASALKGQLVKESQHKILNIALL